MTYKLRHTDQKALEINLDNSIYGTFAEIGAGQEVARNFFQVGAAAGTIAKTMSAYDKHFSDAIYGAEDSGRYVCESRLYKMLDHEYSLMEERLDEVREGCKFFVFADTVAAINYQKTIKGQGWLGLRFRLAEDSAPNDMVIHVKMLDNDNKLQQEAIGVLGVNMLYACYFYHDDPEAMVKSLMDGLYGRMEIDLIRMTGPDFDHVDNRLLCLYLVKYGHTEVIMFDDNKTCIHASEFLYKKSLVVVRGHYRPPTKVSEDVFKSSLSQFKKEEKVNEEKVEMLAELTLENLKVNGEEITEKDFLARADCLAAMGIKVILSNCINHQNLINYLSDFKIKHLGLVIGARELSHIIHEKYILNQDGRLLVAFGELFTKNITIYVYPSYFDNEEKLVEADGLPVPEGITFLYKHLLDSDQIVKVQGYDKKLLSIYPADVFNSINSDNDSWKNWVPESVARVIQENEYFGYHLKEITV